MFSLINDDDSKIMSYSKFVKNAVFYKDMFAFFDAYENLMSKKKKEIPTFCLQNKNEYCLEGICLFMKIYASELGFETIRLSLDYLRVIYYTIAGYSQDGKSVDRQVIQDEFLEYKQASVNVVKKVKSELEGKKKAFEEKKSVYEKYSNAYAKNLIASKFLSVFACVFLVAGVVLAMLPFTFYFLGYWTIKLAILVSASILVVVDGIGLILRAFAKKTSANSDGMAYSLQLAKKEKDLHMAAFKTAKDKANKIISEKYEYFHTLSECFAGKTTKLDFENILQQANEYNFKSFNVPYDVRRLFISQQAEVSEMVAEINNLNALSTKKAELQNIYNEIKTQDWLYYNNEIRFTYLKKFVEIAEKSHIWSLGTDEVINPFGVDIRSMAKEDIAYLNSRDELFVASTVDKFLDTKYAKELGKFEITGSTNAEDLKRLKVEYINHFFNYEKVKDFNNLFYDKKIISGVKVSDDVTMENEKIPTYVYLKIKLLENNIGLGNSESGAIKQIIAKLPNSEDVLQLEESEILNQSNSVYPVVECELVEEVDENYVRYVFGDHSILGYKLSNV